VDLWAQLQLDGGAEASSVRRRLSGISSFYRYAAAHDLVPGVPTAGVARPVVDPDYTATVGVDRDQARAVLAEAEKDVGRQRLRTNAVVKLLLHNASGRRNVRRRCDGPGHGQGPPGSYWESGANRGRQVTRAQMIHVVVWLGWC
jgi:hypothetical protein